MCRWAQHPARAWHDCNGPAGAEAQGAAWLRFRMTVALTGGQEVLLALAGLGAGLANGVAGGGTLISFPALLSRRLPGIDGQCHLHHRDLAGLPRGCGRVPAGGGQPAPATALAAAHGRRRRRRRRCPVIHVTPTVTSGPSSLTCSFLLAGCLLCNRSWPPGYAPPSAAVPARSCCTGVVSWPLSTAPTSEPPWVSSSWPSWGWPRLSPWCG